MRVALAQMRVLPGRPERNVATMATLIDQARDRGCRFVAFPEMCVGGYLLGDRWLEDAWCEELVEQNERIRRLSEGIVVVYGNVYLDRSGVNKDGRIRKFNAGYAFHDGRAVPRPGPAPDGVAIKSLLPNYREFDDERYFFSLLDLAVDLDLPIQTLLQPFEATIDGTPTRFGVEICEDLWSNDYRCAGRPLNVTRHLIENGAGCIFNLSSSPWTFGKDRARNNRVQESFRDAGGFVPFYYVNCVGTQNNGKNLVVFDGDSTVYDAQAQVVASASTPFEQELVVHDTARVEPMAKRPLDRIEAKYRAILEGIRGVDETMGSSSFPYVIGISGGVDSALVACLLRDAIGSARVLGFNMPSRYNSDETRSYAAHVAERLGIHLHTVPINELAAVNNRLLEPFEQSALNRENVQAKVRGTNILSNVAGIRGGVMTCNGNKVEIALGYATLYGDVNGALAPIGDLLKTEIFAMARFLNERVYGDEVVPRALLPDDGFEFGFPPSAELAAGQVDPMKWGYHDALVEAFTTYRRASAETILGWYHDGQLAERLRIPGRLLTRYGLEDPRTFVADLEWVVTAMQRAVFKRIQAPPIIILSKGSYGFDIRESQLPTCWTTRYRELKEKVLAR
jgi:NAD+ synthase (glutamine-hydrolysing)